MFTKLTELFGISNDMSARASKDHPNDNAATRAAVWELAAYNRQQSKEEFNGLCGDSIVRLCADENGGRYVLGWVHPGFHESVAIRLFENGDADWSEIEVPEGDGERFTDFNEHSIAAGVLAVLEKHRFALLGDGAKPALGGHTAAQALPRVPDGPHA